jgi:hypothetical protein
LLRDVPFSAIYWPCYEFLRPQRYNFVETFLAGAFAGTVASTVTLPMDVIKTRLQIELGENIVNSSNNGTTRFVCRVMICIVFKPDKYVYGEESTLTLILKN